MKRDSRLKNEKKKILKIKKFNKICLKQYIYYAILI